MYYIGRKCTPSFERKEMLHYKRRGRSEHDSSQATMLSTFVFRQVNTRVGKESEGLADLWASRAWRGLPRGCLCVSVHVCVCMGHHAYFSHFSTVGATNCRNKECSYLGFTVSRITCSIECVHHYLLITLSLLFTLFLVATQWLPLTISPSSPSLSLSSAPFLPRGLCLLTLTKLKGLSLGQAWATWKLQKQIPLTSLPPSWLLASGQL